MRAGGPRNPTSDGTLHGVYFAVVTQNKDDTQKRRVKVRLPWLDNGGQDQAHWAELATPMAGAEYGWYTLPDVDDVVAVMFIAGDITRPVVLGGVWSKKDTPPETGPDFRGYKGRSGARVVMDDSSKGKVYFADKTDKISLTVGEFADGGDGPNKRAAPKPPTISGSSEKGVNISSMDGSVAMSAKGNLTVEANHIEITSKTDGTDLKGQNAEYKGTSVNCFGGSAAKLEGSSTEIN